MKQFLLLLLILFFACTSNSPDSPYTKISEKIDFREFENPSKNYRAVPFYSLNDLLDSTELDRQIVEFAKGGYGGVYLHSRTGLLTEYLGKDWWKVMDAGAKACEKTNTYAWFYDEDKWPSGFAGGLVPLKSEEYHARCLMRLNKSEKLPANSVLISQDSVYNYLSYKTKTGNPWYNGTCYVDLLNPGTVREFIASSYAPYATRYKEYFNNQTALGIFTDEPQLLSSVNDMKHDGVVSFSPVLIEKFRQDNRYDLIPVIPCLFDTIPGYEKIRLDYYRSLSRQLESSFSKQIGDYCAANHMMFTGHYNGEEGFASVRNNVGNLMLQLRNMQQPGMDHLGLRIEGALNVARQVSSVANQYGIARRLSEAYGISGQNMNFEDRAWIASWHTLMGINHLCPHLALYSMKGTRKRDYPPTLSFQQPYWYFNKLLEDYVARLCYMATVGHYAPEFLVVHPLESDYIEGGTNQANRDRRLSKYNALLKSLQENHRDYDLGDEQIIAETASVKNNCIMVGKQFYKGIILPHMLTIRQSTLNLLKQFAGNGGRIMIVGMPVYIDGIKDTAKLDELKKIATLVSEDDFVTEVQKEVIPEVTVTGDHAGDIWVSHRLSGEKHILQITNTSRKKPVRCKIDFRDKADHLVLLDPAYGRGYTVQNNNGYKLLLHPAQSYVLADPALVAGFVSDDAYSIPSGENEILVLSGDWTGNRQDVNTLTLDFARYSVDEGKTFTDPEPVIGIHERFTAQRYNGFLILNYDFRVDSLPASCNLVLEQPEMYSKIEINGKPVQFDGNSFYRDLSFKTTKVDNLLKTGSNTISLFLNYKAPVTDSRDPFLRYGSEIESIYLTGDFAVRADTSIIPAEPSQHNVRGFLVPKPVHRFASFAITKEKETFDGDLATLGYPFYNGSFLLEKEIEINSVDGNKSYFLKFPLSEAIIIKVSVNGTELPPVAWSPWEVEITGAVKQGRNAITVTLINSLRNMLGPHHNAEGELISLTPMSFTGRNSWATGRKGEDDWYDRRLKGSEKTNIWRDDYYIIPFGFLKEPVVVVRDKQI